MKKNLPIPKQLGLPFSWTESSGAGASWDFFGDSCNMQAWSWIKNWPEWPGSGLIICGKKGWGLSYMAQVWCHVTGAVRLEKSMNIEAVFMAHNAVHLWVPDVHRWAENDADSRRLLQMYNAVRERGGTVLMTGGIPFYAGVLPDLSSRLRALTCVSLTAPTPDFLKQLVGHWFHKNGAVLGEGVVSFLAEKLTPPLSSIQSIVQGLSAESLRLQKKISLNFLKNNNSLWHG